MCSKSSTTSAPCTPTSTCPPTCSSASRASREASRRSRRERARPVERDAAVDPLQAPLAGEGPAVGALGAVVQLAVREHAPGARHGGDAAGEVDRPPEPVAGPRQREADRGAGAQLRELLAL